MCRIGCSRIDEKALVSQPWVGMMDGVAASRWSVLARLSVASLERRGQQVGPADQRVEIHPDLLRAAARPGRRWRAERARRQRRPADAGGLNLGIDRLEVGQHPDAGVALG